MVLRKKILVVEDNLLNRELLCQILAEEYDLLQAENGLEALDLLKQYGEGISLVLLDIVMPVMDGYTFLSIMKADPAYASIPVIVTTQNDGESEEVAALSHGATDFVAKPYKPQIILHRVAGIINFRETAAMMNLIQYDRLTGLYNKEFFYQQVKEILLRNPQKEYDLLCSDVENFKLINDVFGVAAGDRLLKGIGKMCQEGVKQRGICGRLNSDQFACLVERCVVYTDQYFIEATEQVSAYTDQGNLSIKWGIYAVEDRAISVEQMCDRAVLAACSIKGKYGKYFARYDDKLRNQMLRERAITDSMETALKERQFQIYMQPKYRILDESLVGAEALVRWNHPQWGFQSPAEFIPLFEKNGFITKLDQFVWESACAALRDWDNKGYCPISVSVNVSRADIYNADLPEILMKIVQTYGLSPARLHLEITESAYTNNPSQIIETVSHLRELGFIIEMDDFGSGYSSLNMLNEMPIDVLKLDMKFIQNETAKPNSQGILQFIISLARWMQLSVVAEGVETKKQLDKLGEIGCDYVQGYYFARPMPCEEFERLLAEQNCVQEEVRLKSTIQLFKERPILLIADEDVTYRESVKDAFKGHYHVVSVENGKEVLDAIETYKHIAAIVLSLTLPDQDGFQILKAAQQKKMLWEIPIIVTSTPDPGLEKRALESGADDFISKPFFMESLQKRLQRAVSFSLNQEKTRILQDAAFRDHLTGVLNRRGLEAAMNTLSKDEMPFAVCIFDLDDLKRCNDTCGHAKGDQILARFGTVLRAHTRGKDVLARIGGDEFLALIKQIPSEEVAEKKAAEICAAAKKEILDGKKTISCSGGVALMRPGDVAADIIEKADKALYQAKAGKKGSCHLWREATP